MNPWTNALPCRTPYRRWLRDQGSLTRRLQAGCAEFAVQRLRQRMERPFPDEGLVLGLRPRDHAWVREVLLLCASRPVVFAHSVLPLEALRGPWQSITRLGDKPLGAALFANPQVRRQTLEYKRLDRRHPLYRAAAAHLSEPPRTLWARRSRFTLRGAPILVTEVFLPEVLDLP